MDEAHTATNKEPQPAGEPAPGVRDRLAALIEVLLCSGFPTQVALGATLMAAGLQPFDEAGHLSMRYVLAVSLADTVLIVGLVWVFLRQHGERPLEVIAGRRPWMGEAWVALPVLLAVVAAVVAVLVAVRTWAPWLDTVARSPFEDLAAGRSGALVLGLVAVLAGGLREEVQRAFVLHRFDRYLGGGGLGLVLFSVAFGAGHAIQGWDVAIATGVMGTIWGAVYLARRSAVAPMLSHALFNAGEVFRYTLFGL